MSAKDDLKWLKDFQTKYGTVGKRMPPKLDKRLDEVEKSHENLRKILGDRNKTFSLKEEAGFEPLNISLVQPILDRVSAILPDYLSHYGLTGKDFCQPKLPKACRSMSGAKHVVGYAKRQKLDETRQKQVEDLMAKLGQLWQSCQKVDKSIYCTICTCPQAFALIGNFGIDRGSCHAEGAFNAVMKYCYGLRKDGFVALFHKNKEVEIKDNNPAIIGRCYGVLSEKAKGFHSFNHYPYYYYNNTGEQIGTSSDLEKVAKSMFDVKETEVYKGSMTISGGLSYMSAGHGIFEKGSGFRPHESIAVPYMNGPAWTAK